MKMDRIFLSNQLEERSDVRKTSVVLKKQVYIYILNIFDIQYTVYIYIYIHTST